MKEIKEFSDQMSQFQFAISEIHQPIEFTFDKAMLLIPEFDGSIDIEIFIRSLLDFYHRTKTQKKSERHNKNRWISQVPGVV